MSLVSTAIASLALAVAAIDPVPTINATKYLGKWYQMYSDLSEVFIETQYCVTANYGLNNNGTVSVWNRDRSNSVTGPLNEIFGWAEQDTKTPSILTVHLQGVPVGAPYWIVGLGQPTYGKDGLYEWAIVSDPLKLSLFVLARNVSMYNAYWNETVFELLDADGFNGLVNSPIQTIQDGCPDIPFEDKDYWRAQQP